MRRKTIETVWTNTTLDEKVEKWGEGPWCNEPDKVQWVDEQTNLDCLIVRNYTGALCGYVGVPEGHRFYGLDYNELHSIIPGLSTHGGLTFAGGCQETDDPSHGICHIPLDGRPDTVWWFGFDCAHSWDIVPLIEKSGFASIYGRNPFGGEYRTLDYVKKQCSSLAKQLANET